MNVNTLIGKTLQKVTVNRDGDEIYFTVSKEEDYLMYHPQDCCEWVTIEDISGDINDLVGYPILQAEEVSNYRREPLEDYDASFTWTFYKFATVKGYVTIRWYGTSNGYYSEEVCFKKINVKDES